MTLPQNLEQEIMAIRQNLTTMVVELTRIAHSLDDLNQRDLWRYEGTHS